MTHGLIFRTMTRNDGAALVLLEPGKRGGTILTVRKGGPALPLLAVPVEHATAAVVGSVLDDVDTCAVLARIGERIA